MNKYYQQYSDWFEQRNKREKIIIIISSLVVIYFMWDNFFIYPMSKETQKLNADKVNLRGKIALVNQQISDIVRKSKSSVQLNDPLQLKAKQITERLNKFTSELITPRQMLDALKAILVSDNSLTLLSVETKEPEIIGSDDQSINIISNQTLYKHVLVIKFTGKFADVVKYLQLLEGQKRKIFWDSLDYQVTKYPKATVTLTIHTLSTKKGWLSV